jgi:cytohesin
VRWAAAVAFLLASLHCVAQILDDNLRDAGFTELHSAVWSGDVAAIRRLVKAGANVNAAAEFGTTPLHSAAMKGSAEVVRTLLELGASLEAMDRHGRTPLFIAAEVNPSPKDVIEALLSAGASADVRDRFGKTPRDACWTKEACRALSGPQPAATR